MDTKKRVELTTYTRYNEPMAEGSFWETETEVSYQIGRFLALAPDPSTVVLVQRVLGHFLQVQHVCTYQHAPQMHKVTVSRVLHCKERCRVQY